MQATRWASCDVARMKSCQHSCASTHQLEAHDGDGDHAAPEQQEQQETQHIGALAVLVFLEDRLGRRVLLLAAAATAEGGEDAAHLGHTHNSKTDVNAASRELGTQYCIDTAATELKQHSSATQDGRATHLAFDGCKTDLSVFT